MYYNIYQCNYIICKDDALISIIHMVQNKTKIKNDDFTFERNALEINSILVHLIISIAMDYFGSLCIRCKY